MTMHTLLWTNSWTIRLQRAAISWRLLYIHVYGKHGEGCVNVTNSYRPRGRQGHCVVSSSGHRWRHFRLRPKYRPSYALQGKRSIWCLCANMLQSAIGPMAVEVDAFRPARTLAMHADRPDKADQISTAWLYRINMSSQRDHVLRGSIPRRWRLVDRAGKRQRTIVIIHCISFYGSLHCR